MDNLHTTFQTKWFMPVHAYFFFNWKVDIILKRNADDVDQAKTFVPVTRIKFRWNQFIQVVLNVSLKFVKRHPFETKWPMNWLGWDFDGYWVSIKSVHKYKFYLNCSMVSIWKQNDVWNRMTNWVNTSLWVIWVQVSTTSVHKYGFYVDLKISNSHHFETK